MLFNPTLFQLAVEAEKLARDIRVDNTGFSGLNFVMGNGDEGYVMWEERICVCGCNL